MAREFGEYGDADYLTCFPRPPAIQKLVSGLPFFWSQYYDVPINYVGHADQWDEIAIDGEINAKDCLLRYKRNGLALAIASIFRDVENLQGELAME